MLTQLSNADYNHICQEWATGGLHTIFNFIDLFILSDPLDFKVLKISPLITLE